jgi:hypothetical protein
VQVPVIRKISLQVSHRNYGVREAGRPRTKGKYSLFQSVCVSVFSLSSLFSLSLSVAGGIPLKSCMAFHIWCRTLSRVKQALISLSHFLSLHSHLSPSSLSAEAEAKVGGEPPPDSRSWSRPYRLTLILTLPSSSRNSDRCCADRPSCIGAARSG